MENLPQLSRIKHHLSLDTPILARQGDVIRLLRVLARRRTAFEGWRLHRMCLSVLPYVQILAGMMTTSCRFCGVRDGQNIYGSADTKLTESERFFAIPSIGSLVEGWTLVIPKKHKISLRDDYADVDFQRFVIEVAETLQTAYGPLVAFEHGPMHEGSATGCGTDHAHLHLVPFAALTSTDLISAAVSFVEKNVNEIRDFVAGEEYLSFFENPAEINRRCWVALLDKPISQFFRKIIGSKLGLDVSKVDYKTNINENISASTLAALAPKFSLAHAND